MHTMRSRKGREIPVRSQEHAHAVSETQRGYAGVMDLRTPQFAIHQYFCQNRPVALRFTDELKISTRMPALYRSYGNIHWRGREEYFWVSDDSNQRNRRHQKTLRHGPPGDCRNGAALPAFPPHGGAWRAFRANLPSSCHQFSCLNLSYLDSMFFVQPQDVSVCQG